MKITRLNEVYGMTSNYAGAIVSSGCSCCCSTCTCCCCCESYSG